MYLYQRELAGGAASQNQERTLKPTSPYLIPMASPGPITPLELEDAKSYLAVSANATNAASHSDKLIRKEAIRHEGPPK